MSNSKNKGKVIIVYALLLIAALSFRLALARWLPNEEPVDSQVYAQLARNVIEQGVYSPAVEPPYQPSIIRVPGYPLFVAGIYSVFGIENNGAVRIVQAVVDTLSCGLIALIAFLWDPNSKRKRRTSIAALFLAAFCPFTAIYVATVLPETLLIFLSMATCLTATLAFKANAQKSIALLWAATGLLAGAGVLVRPDIGLTAVAIGITLVISTLVRKSAATFASKRDEVLLRFARASYLVALLCLTFCLALVPWALRNHRVFKVFQPLAPAYAVMPGEFVPRGYFAWLGTWVNDTRYVGQTVWSLDEYPIKLEELPDHAFDSPEEKLRVATLLEKYNNAPGATDPFGDEESLDEKPPGDESDPPEETELERADSQGEAVEEREDPESMTEEQPATEAEDSAEQATTQLVQMTPEIDAGFARIANERIDRNKFRYYLLLPFRRGVSLWFDTHSQYYPFEGELLPFANLDAKTHQQIWLPAFAVLTLIFSLLGIQGGRELWQSGEFEARRWVLLATLLFLLRIGYFATLENPEPRFTVELFPFLAILGGIALSSFLNQVTSKRVSK